LIPCLILLFATVQIQQLFAQLPVDPAPGGYATYKGNIPHGVLKTVQYKSKTVGTTRKVEVYTPPGYTPSKKYPVMYLLHGIGGNENEWKYYSNPDFILDNLYAQNKLTPMIVVFPNGRAMKDDRPPANLFSSENMNAFANFEYDLINDLIPFIDTTYSVLTGSENRALAGYSMGGGQSLNFGLGHMDKFAWVGGFSAAPNVKSASQLVPKPAETNEKMKLIYMACGDQDGLLSSNRDIHNYLTSKKVKHIWFVVKGAHETKVWQNDLYNFSQLIFKSAPITSAINISTSEPGFTYNQSTKNIQLNNPEAKKNIEIHTIAGQLMKYFRGAKIEIIGLQGFKSGLYVLRLMEGNKISSGKFRIQ